MVEENNSKMKDLVGFTEEELVEAYGSYGYALMRKSEMCDEITNLAQKLVEAKNSERSHFGDLWNNTIWEDVLTGKITVDNKKAYVREHISEYKADCEEIENKINDCWGNIDIINTFLKIGGLDD